MVALQKRLERRSGGAGGEPAEVMPMKTLPVGVMSKAAEVETTGVDST